MVPALTRFVGYAACALIVVVLYYQAALANNPNKLGPGLGSLVLVFGITMFISLVVEALVNGPQAPVPPPRAAPAPSVDPAVAPPETEDPRYSFDWRFHRLPLAVAAVLTVLFYVFAYFLAGVL